MRQAITFGRTVLGRYVRDRMVDRQGAICAPCYRGLSFVGAPFCRVCGVPFPYALAEGEICPACAAAPPPFGRARAALRYDEGAKRLILPFKYADRTEIAAVLAPHMARAGRELLADADLLVPVPLHPRRLRARRYNQAALLAGALSRLSGRPVLVDALRRTVATPPLGELGAEAREMALRDAFLVARSRQAAVAGRHVLLVDDVMTSGATAGACATALLAGGAAGVDVLAAARVPDPRLG